MSYDKHLDCEDELRRADIRVDFLEQKIEELETELERYKSSRRFDIGICCLLYTTPSPRDS